MPAMGQKAEILNTSTSCPLCPRKRTCAGPRGALSLDWPRAFRTGGVTGQPECPQARGLLAHRLQFGLVLGRCLLTPAELLFFFEQRFCTAVCLVGIHTQCGTPCKSPEKISTRRPDIVTESN